MHVWIRHKWLFDLWYPASSCGSPHSLSQAPAAKCIQSSSNCNTWLPGSSLRQQLRLESQLHLLGWRSNCLACDLYQLLWYSSWGPLRQRASPLSGTSWEFWCLHPSTTHRVAACQMQPRGWVLYSVFRIARRKPGIPAWVIVNRTKVLGPYLS